MINIEQFFNQNVIPVVVLNDAEKAVPTANALLAGGIGVMEITLRTAAALDSIRAIRQQCPQMLVGAGTVITPEQCEQAVSAGAAFIVSPGFDAEIVSWCLARDIPVLPGCVTPTEIMAGLRLGLHVFKFFPANVYGGLKAMKALAGPFGKVKFVPTGGVSAENLAEYLAAPYIMAVGGSWLCTAADIDSGNWERITALAREASLCGR